MPTYAQKYALYIQSAKQNEVIITKSSSKSVPTLGDDTQEVSTVGHHENGTV